MRSLVLFILSAAAAFAASSPFDGRWDITIAGDSAHASWLGLEGVGTPRQRHFRQRLLGRPQQDR